LLLSFGNTIGAGIFALSGISSKAAGEAVVFSWIIAGCVSFLTALVYAEFSSKIRKAGSSFIYAYAITGEFSAWLIAWNMFARYGMAASI
jgi:amino acid transporter